MVTLTSSYTKLYMKKKQTISLEYVLKFNQQSIHGIIIGLRNIRLCNGICYGWDVPKTFQTEVMSIISDENSSKRIVRSKSCKNLLPYCGKTDTCKTCSDSFNRFNKDLHQILWNRILQVTSPGIPFEEQKWWCPSKTLGSKSY